MGCVCTKEEIRLDFKRIYKKFSDTRYIVRELHPDDYYIGFEATLAVFHGSDITEESYYHTLNTIKKSSYIHKVIVVEDKCARKIKDKIIGSGTLFVKPNFLFTNDAYIEDISLRYDRDADTAKRIVECLKMMSYEIGCRKILTRTREFNVAFFGDYDFKEEQFSLDYNFNIKKVVNNINNKKVRRMSVEEQELMPTPQHKQLERKSTTNEQSTEPPQQFKSMQ